MYELTTEFETEPKYILNRQKEERQIRGNSVPEEKNKTKEKKEMSEKYAIMHIEKLKNPGAMVSRYNHDYRLADVSNADKSKEHENEILIATSEGKNYYEAGKERVEGLDYYQNHKIRKNAVLAFDVVLSYSNASGIDVNEWKENSVEWLKQTFDKAPDGKSNVLSAVLHMDEIHDAPSQTFENSHNSPHIHAVITPVDENGKLNASRWTDGARALAALQDSYAKQMVELGLRRGVRNSSARHEDMRKMYGRFDEAMENIPKPREEETAYDYYVRAKDELQTAHVRSMRNIDDHFREMQRYNDTGIDMQMDEVDIHFAQKEKELNRNIQEKENTLKDQEEELERKQAVIEKEIKNKTKKVKEIDEEYRSYQNELADLQERMAALLRYEESLEEMAEDVSYMNRLRKGLQNIKAQDENLGSRYEEMINSIENRGREKEIEEEKVNEKGYR